MGQSPLAELLARLGDALQQRESALLQSLDARLGQASVKPADDRCGYQLRPSRPVRATLIDNEVMQIDLQANVGMEIYGFTVRCTDDRGLDAFRLGWKFKGEDDQDRTEFWEPGDDQTTYPIASQVTVATLAELHDLVHRPLAGRTLSKDDRLYFIAQNDSGAKPYDVEIVVWSWVQVSR